MVVVGEERVLIDGYIYGGWSKCGHERQGTLSSLKINSPCVLTRLADENGVAQAFIASKGSDPYYDLYFTQQILDTRGQPLRFNRPRYTFLDDCRSSRCDVMWESNVGPSNESNTLSH